MVFRKQIVFKYDVYIFILEKYILNDCSLLYQNIMQTDTLKMLFIEMNYLQQLLTGKLCVLRLETNKLFYIHQYYNHFHCLVNQFLYFSKTCLGHCVESSRVCIKFLFPIF